MRHGRPTEQELRQIFHELLERAIAGGGLYSCHGLDDETDQALWAVAGAAPADRADLVAAAYRAFAGQLDGSNAARRHADLERWFEAREQRRRDSAGGGSG